LGAVTGLDHNLPERRTALAAYIVKAGWVVFSHWLKPKRISVQSFGGELVIGPGKGYRLRETIFASIKIYLSSGSPVDGERLSRPSVHRLEKQ
jgi:hypothetical protein